MNVSALVGESIMGTAEEAIIYLLEARPEIAGVPQPDGSNAGAVGMSRRAMRRPGYIGNQALD
jgi:hypothetical protein